MESTPNRCELIGYLEEALPNEDMTRIERLLRTDPSWKEALRDLQENSDFGDHSVAMIWRRNRLTCGDREKLWAYAMGALVPDEEDYFKFHLDVIKCRCCEANLNDLQDKIAKKGVDETGLGSRHRKFFKTSVGHLPKPKNK